jgi:hypothetical protein
MIFITFKMYLHIAIFSYIKMKLSIRLPVKHIFTYHLGISGKGFYQLTGNPGSFCLNSNSISI